MKVPTYMSDAMLVLELPIKYLVAWKCINPYWLNFVEMQLLNHHLCTYDSYFMYYLIQLSLCCGMTSGVFGSCNVCVWRVGWSL